MSKWYITYTPSPINSSRFVPSFSSHSSLCPVFSLICASSAASPYLVFMVVFMWQSEAHSRLSLNAVIGLSCPLTIPISLSQSQSCPRSSRILVKVFLARHSLSPNFHTRFSVLVCVCEWRQRLTLALLVWYFNFCDNCAMLNDNNYWVFHLCLFTLNS